MWGLIVSVPDHCLSFYITFYEKTLNHKSKPSTSTSSVLPAHRIYFFSTQTLHSITFLFCFNSKYHFNFLCVKIMEKWYDMRSQDVVDIMH